MFRCFTEHVPASLLPELFRTLTEFFSTVYFAKGMSVCPSVTLVHWTVLKPEEVTTSGLFSSI